MFLGVGTGGACAWAPLAASAMHNAASAETRFGILNPATTEPL
jgi:hypothetical protein